MTARVVFTSNASVVPRTHRCSVAKTLGHILLWLGAILPAIGFGQSDLAVDLEAVPSDIRPSGTSGTVSIGLSNLGPTQSLRPTVSLLVNGPAVLSGTPVDLFSIPETACTLSTELFAEKVDQQKEHSPYYYYHRFEFDDLQAGESSRCQVGFSVNAGLIGQIRLTWQADTTFVIPPDPDLSNNSATMVFGTPAPVIFLAGFEDPVCTNLHFPPPPPAFCTAQSGLSPVYGFSISKNNQSSFCLTTFREVWGPWRGNGDVANVSIPNNTFIAMPFFADELPGKLGEISYGVKGSGSLFALIQLSKVYLTPFPPSRYRIIRPNCSSFSFNSQH